MNKDKKEKIASKKQSKEIIQPELNAILENIDKYIAVNDNEVCFIGSFVSFKRQPKGKKENADRIIALGPKKILRDILNDLRDLIEDEADKDDFVSV